jgi:hypothetical protein
MQGFAFHFYVRLIVAFTSTRVVFSVESARTKNDETPFCSEHFVNRSAVHTTLTIRKKTVTSNWATTKIDKQQQQHKTDGLKIIQNF